MHGNRVLHLLTRRGLMIIAVLILLTFSIGQSSQVQAQGTEAFRVDVISPKLVVCVGEKINYRVVILDSESVAAGDPYEYAMTTMARGTEVTAQSLDSSVGDFTTARLQLSYSPFPAM